MLRDGPSRATEQVKNRIPSIKYKMSRRIQINVEGEYEERSNNALIYHIICSGCVMVWFCSEIRYMKSYKYMNDITTSIN